MSRWVLACPLEALDEGRGRRVELGQLALCLVRVGAVVYAVEDRCPHRGARLSAGLLYEACKMVCPDHGWIIDLASGRVEPPDSGQVARVAVEVRGADVFVDLDSLQ